MTDDKNDLSDICPCCGSQVRVDYWVAALDSLTPQERDIVKIVKRRPGLRAAALADVIYANRIDGGPLWAADITRRLLLRARRKMAPFGFRLWAGHGSRSGYRITYTPPGEGSK